MQLRNNYILDPPVFLRPVYNISPYPCLQTTHVNKSNSWKSVAEYFNFRYPEFNCEIMINARSALLRILEVINIQQKDNIAIFTTSGNKYISSCVTNTILNKTQWQRNVDMKTKAVLVIHEFGFPFENMEEIARYGLPIIEDCAHSFVSNNCLGTVGKYADFLIFSFPKIFPIQIGGLYLSRTKNNKNIRTNNSETNMYINDIVTNYINEIDDICIKRKNNYNYLTNRIKHFGMFPRFTLSSATVPGVFIFNTTKNIKLDRMKIRFQNNGIESSVFYGENAFFFPIHQYLTVKDLGLFLTLLESCNEGEYGDF